MPPRSTTQTTTTQTTTTTTRTRDNQRRSRARRREYLTALESKWRHCEAVGVAASREIQLAAREVLEENRRLKGLLRGLGVEEGRGGERGGGGGGGACEGDDAARVLEGLLLGGRRWWCGDGDDVSVAGMEVGCGGGGGGEGLGLGLGLGREAETGGGVFSSRGAWSLSHGAAPLQEPLLEESRPPQNRHLPSAPGVGFSPATRIPAVETNHTDALATTASTSTTTTTQSIPDQPSSNPHPPSEVHTQPSSPPAERNATSCRAIADAIRYVRPSLDADQLEAQMGCRSTGEDCLIPNAHAFELMDRFSTDLD